MISIRLGLPLVLVLSLPAQQSEPKERRQAESTYDLNGRTTTRSSASEERQGAVSGRVEKLRGADGQPVMSRTTEERVLQEQDGNRIAERVIQRFDPNGRPTSKQVVRIETRKLADGSAVTAETVYDQDLNGRMQLSERRTTTRNDATSTLLVERQAAGGGFRVVEQVDRKETKRGDTVEAVSSRKLIGQNGRLEEQEREQSISSKSGELTTREAQKWQVGTTGKMDLMERSVSRTTERSDGSAVEDTEVYTTRIAGTTADLNQPGVPTLEQQIHRERKPRADGKILETTSARIRRVAEPARLSGLIVTEQLITPTADGQLIEKTISEKDGNGRMAPVQKVVEEIKK